MFLILEDEHWDILGWSAKLSAPTVDLLSGITIKMPTRIFVDMTSWF